MRLHLLQRQYELGFEELADSLESRQTSPRLGGSVLTQELLAQMIERVPPPTVTSGEFLPYSPFSPT